MCVCRWWGTWFGPAISKRPKKNKKNVCLSCWCQRTKDFPTSKLSTTEDNSSHLRTLQEGSSSNISGGSMALRETSGKYVKSCSWMKSVTGRDAVQACRSHSEASGHVPSTHSSSLYRKVSYAISAKWFTRPFSGTQPQNPKHTHLLWQEKKPHTEESPGGEKSLYFGCGEQIFKMCSDS